MSNESTVEILSFTFRFGRMCNIIIHYAYVLRLSRGLRYYCFRFRLTFSFPFSLLKHKRKYLDSSAYYTIHMIKPPPFPLVLKILPDDDDDDHEPPCTMELPL